MRTPHPAAVWCRFVRLPVLGAFALVVANPVYSADASAAHVSTPSAEISLVFLPLENLGDATDAFLSHGLHEDITVQLARASGVRVMARNSATRLPRSMPATEIARIFRITHVLAGTVRRADGRVRIELELTPAAGGPGWKRAFECSAGDLSPLAGEIASEASRALDLAAPPPARTVHPRAYELHLRALHLHGRLALNPRGQRSRDEECARLWEEALRLDPGFLSASEQLSVVETGISVLSAEPEARAYHAEKAKHWAEIVAAGRGAAGNYPVALYAWRIEQDRPSALLLATHQAAAAPNDAANQCLLGDVFAGMGRVHDSAKAYQRGLDVDPLNPPGWERLLLTVSLSRDAAATRAALARLSALDMRPDPHVAATALFRVEGSLPADVSEMTLAAQVLWEWRGRKFADGLARLDAARRPLSSDLLCGRADLLRRLGREIEARAAAESALAAVERVLPENPGVGDAALARALARVGRGDEAVAAMQRFVRSGRGAPENPSLREVELAELHAYLGRGPEAVQLVGRLLQQPSGLTVPMLRLDPTWDTLRHMPGFEQHLADPRNLAPF